MPSRGELPDPIFSPLKLLKVDVETDFNGVSVVMEFIDNNGTKLITPKIPYPDNFDPMRIENVEYNGGDEIRIKNSNGDLLITLHADSIEYDNPIGTTLDANGNMCITPEEGEENLPLRTFTASQADASQVGWGTAISTAIAQTNRAQQNLDNTMQQEANAREAQRSTLGASAWFGEQTADAGGTFNPFNLQFRFPMVNDEHETEEYQIPTPKIKIDFDMKCTCCEGKIHYPDKLISLLGEEGTIKYFDFCKKTNSEPQLFCCECFGIMKNNSHIISAVNKMNQKIKDLMNLNEREKAIEKREKELDEQLKKIKK